MLGVMEPYYDSGGIQIYLGDCREILPTLEVVDLVLTDPPFNVGKDYGASQDDLDPCEYEVLMRTVEASCESQVWVCPTNRLRLFASILGDAALPVVIPRGAHGPKRWGWTDQFDMLLARGKPDGWPKNLWTGIRLKGEGYFFREQDFGHPGYTPEPIMKRALTVYPHAEVALDPFMGSGTTLRAAKDLGRKCIGIEIEEKYCEIAARRLAQEVLPYA